MEAARSCHASSEGRGAQAGWPSYWLNLADDSMQTVWDISAYRLPLSRAREGIDRLLIWRRGLSDRDTLPSTLPVRRLSQLSLRECQRCTRYSAGSPALSQTELTRAA